MNPALQQLQPLLYPAPEPVSPSWLISALWLLPLTLALLSGLIFYLRRQTALPATGTVPLTREQQLLSALEELQQLPPPLPGQQAGPWLQQLNLLLKRFCAVRYPDLHGHRLTGREWLAFLDSRCPAAGLTRWMVLVEGSYQPDCRLQQHSIDGISQAVTLWMRKHV